MLPSQCSIESDPAFANVGSEEFVSKYVRHDMPAIANIATILLGIRDKELALQEKTSQLDELKNKQKINKLEPCKMEIALKYTTLLMTTIMRYSFSLDLSIHTNSHIDIKLKLLVCM
jgi:hypothetical protein